MTLAHPEALWLLPLAALAAWALPRLAVLSSPLRALVVLLFVLWLADPRVPMGVSGMDLWVLVDRSDSAAGAMGASRTEMERLLEAGRGAEDRLHWVDFAEAPVLRNAGAVFEPATGSTRLASAVRYALGLHDSERPSRLLVITDGESTEDLSGLEASLKRAGFPLDLRLLPRPGGVDYRVGRITAPVRVVPGQAFVLEMPVFGPGDGTVNYEVDRDGQTLGGGSVNLTGGRGVIRITSRAGRTGASRFEVRLLPEDDSVSGNNAASHWVEAAASGSVLLVTNYPDDPLAAVLEAAGLSIEVASDPAAVHSGLLAGPRAVLLNNVGADELDAGFLEALDFFVRSQGGGLAMWGGPRSFGSGGYFGSPLDPLLPVSMELREEHRKLATALALVLDRSGSMAAGAGPGITKMDLANEGAARAVSLLGPSDAVAAFAVDSEPHRVVPLSRVGGDAARISTALHGIRSGGGGIFVYRGLEAAWQELQKSEAGQKHVILFSDAADSEEPGDYQKLIAEMDDAGATLSVIALGSETDPDAELLKDIAVRGKGRIFFNADPAQLPALFAQETVSVARSVFLEEPVAVVDAGGWIEIDGTSGRWPPRVDAYNLSYLREGATAAAVSGDSYGAPLVAFWQRGAGRVATVTFPVAGSFSERFRAWNGAASFLQTLARWILPASAPPGTALRTRFSGADLLFEFFHDTENSARFAARPPRLVYLAVDGSVADVPMERAEPGRFTALVSVPPGHAVRGAIDLGDTRIPVGPLDAGIDPEWSADPRTRSALIESSARSGGRILSDLRTAWLNSNPRGEVPIRRILLVLAGCLFLVDIAWVRWFGHPGAWPGIRLPRTLTKGDRVPQ